MSELVTIVTHKFELGVFHQSLQHVPLELSIKLLTKRRSTFENFENNLENLLNFLISN